MRALFTIAIAAAMCAAASALVCGVAPDFNPYTPNNCSAFATCDDAFCVCAGAAATDRNPTTCLGSATANCSHIQACLRTFSACVIDIRNLRPAAIAAEQDCRDTAAVINTTLLVASGGNYNGSALELGCRYRTCIILNATNVCPMGTNEAVCELAGRDSATATLAPEETPGNGSHTGSATGAGSDIDSSDTTGAATTSRAPSTVDDGNAAAATSVFAAAGVAIAALAFAL